MLRADPLQHQGTPQQQQDQGQALLRRRRPIALVLLRHALVLQRVRLQHAALELQQVYELAVAPQ